MLGGRLSGKLGVFLLTLLVCACSFLYGAYLDGLLPNPHQLSLVSDGLLVMSQILTNVHLGILGFAAFIFFFITTKEGARTPTERNYLFVGGLLMFWSGTGLLNSFFYQIYPVPPFNAYASLFCFAVSLTLLLWVAIKAVRIGFGGQEATS